MNFKITRVEKEWHLDIEGEDKIYVYFTMRSVMRKIEKVLRDKFAE